MQVVAAGGCELLLQRCSVLQLSSGLNCGAWSHVACEGLGSDPQ